MLLIDVDASFAAGITVALVGIFALNPPRLIDQKKPKWTVAQLDPGHLCMTFPMGSSKCAIFH